MSDLPTSDSHPPATEPRTVVVHVIERKKKRRRKVSRELRDVEQVERHLSRAAQRTARAVAAGLDTYRRCRRRSAKRKRDGAFRDLPRNAAAGMAETLRRRLYLACALFASLLALSACGTRYIHEICVDGACHGDPSVADRGD